MRGSSEDHLVCCFGCSSPLVKVAKVYRGLLQALLMFLSYVTKLSTACGATGLDLFKANQPATQLLKKH